MMARRKKLISRVGKLVSRGGRGGVECFPRESVQLFTVHLFWAGEELSEATEEAEEYRNAAGRYQEEQEEGEQALRNQQVSTEVI